MGFYDFLIWLGSRPWFLLLWLIFLGIVVWKNVAPSKKNGNKRFPWETKAQWEERKAYIEKELERRQEAKKNRGASD